MGTLLGTSALFELNKTFVNQGDGWTLLFLFTGYIRKCIKQAQRITVEQHALAGNELPIHGSEAVVFRCRSGNHTYLNAKILGVRRHTHLELQLMGVFRCLSTEALFRAIMAVALTRPGFTHKFIHCFCG